MHYYLSTYLIGKKILRKASEMKRVCLLVLVLALLAGGALAALGVVVRPDGPPPVGLIVLTALAWVGGAAVASSGRLIARPWRPPP